jgi:SSS family solute:Na+ symporter
MTIHPVDIAIIVAYVIIVVIAGVLLSRQASKNLDSYFLGDKRVPWYFLGISNASSMYDITGTMWMVYLMFAYGVKSAWIPWLWPHFTVVFMMVYLGVWLRRSNVLTGAEWMLTRFGSGLGADLSRLGVSSYAIVAAIGFLGYAFQGIGKFAAVFFPWEISPHIYAIIIMGLTTFYVILGGMFSVVLTDIIQYAILSIVSIIVAVIAMMRTTPELIAANVPEGWTNLFFGWRLHLDWTGLVDAINDKISSDGYSLFTIFFMMILFKGILTSMAGPTPNYDMQRSLATRNPKETALMSFFTSVVQFFPRYLLITGITVLAVVYFSPSLQAMGTAVDFEQILPYVIRHFIPVGLVGLLLAGLLAAFMSTFDSTVNAGAAYLVNDIYKRYINPNADPKKYVHVSYLASILVVIVGISFGFMTESINAVLQWIVAGLYGGYIAPNVLKWYWWRLNGAGYFAGMVAGIISALTFPRIFPDLSALNAFPFILILGTLACFLVSLLTKPTNQGTLKQFYTCVRPWGFWEPVYQRVKAENPGFVKNTNFKRDMVNVTIGLIWQTSLVVIPIFIVLKDFNSLLIACFVTILTSIFLKLNWYNKMVGELNA